MQAFTNVLSNTAGRLLQESPVIAELHEALYCLSDITYLQPDVIFLRAH